MPRQHVSIKLVRTGFSKVEKKQRLSKCFDEVDTILTDADVLSATGGPWVAEFLMWPPHHLPSCTDMELDGGVPSPGLSRTRTQV